MKKQRKWAFWKYGFVTTKVFPLLFLLAGFLLVLYLIGKRTGLINKASEPVAGPLSENNYLVNPGFELNVDADSLLPDGWSGINLKAKDTLSTISHEGIYSFAFKPSMNGKKKVLKQQIDFSSNLQMANPYLDMNFWHKTNANYGTGKAVVSAVVTYSDNSKRTLKKVISKKAHNWSYGVVADAIRADVKSITVILLNYDNMATVYLDNFRLNISDIVPPIAPKTPDESLTPAELGEIEALAAN